MQHPKNELKKKRTFLLQASNKSARRWSDSVNTQRMHRKKTGSASCDTGFSGVKERPLWLPSKGEQLVQI